MVIALAVSLNLKAQNCTTGALHRINYVDPTDFDNIHEWNGAIDYQSYDGIQTILVEDGFTLIISNVTVNMVDNGVIRVEPGGQLIFDNCLIQILSGCDDWDGISVEGNDGGGLDPLQYTSSTPKTLKIGSTDDAAYCQIANCTIKNVNGSAVFSTEGGIINIESSTIQNSKIGIKISDYTKHSSKAADEYENACRIYDVTININEIFSTDPYDEFLDHAAIWLEDVSHIVIESCELTNGYASNTDDDRGYGIYANNASFGLTQKLTRSVNSGDGGKGEPTLGENNCPT
ncbi:MAG: right-handed parallel beta-helix repeat-containing protein [Bacteroidetes bacterium]|nr:right-handed parallel beta-helix repeat-containing protein [Bacteroidota bacterium]